MSYGNLFRAVKEFGVVGTWKKLNQTKTIKFGRVVGTDQFGNKYYENTEDYRHGQDRWVEYGRGNFFRAEPDTVPAEWHLWLHRVTDDIPTSTTTGAADRMTPVMNSTGTDAVYENNRGGVQADHEPNWSLWRPRGYGEGNALFSEPGEEKFHKQPGWPLAEEHKHPDPSKPRYDATNTMADVRADEEHYKRVTSSEFVAKLGESGSDLKLSVVKEATFKGGLDAEEAEWLASSPDMEDMEANVAKLEGVVAEYKAMRTSETEEGLALVQEMLDSAVEDLARRRELEARL